jgi:hypothetical protein
MDVCSGSTIPAFSRHVTIPKSINKNLYETTQRKATQNMEWQYTRTPYVERSQEVVWRQDGMAGSLQNLDTVGYKRNGLSK